MNTTIQVLVVTNTNKFIVNIMGCFLFLFIISCSQNKNEDCQKCFDEIDELRKSQEEYKNSVLYNFYSIYKMEKKDSTDKQLIDKYANLYGKDSIVDLYINERISSINNFVDNNEILKNYGGTYLLMNIYKGKEPEVDKIVLTSDRIILYKKNRDIVSEVPKRIYSADEFVEAKYRLGDYFIKILKPNTIILTNNLCMDCEEIHFFKKNR